MLRAALEDVVTQNGTLREWKEAMRKRLKKGDAWATEFVFDRIEGKVVEQLEISGPDGGPVVFDHSAAIAGLAPGPVSDSGTSGTDESAGNGTEMGQELHGGNI